VFEITEAVTSAPILAGCTWCTTALSASRTLVITSRAPPGRLLTLNRWEHTSLGRSTCIDRYITGYLVNFDAASGRHRVPVQPAAIRVPAAVESSRAAAAFAKLLPAPLVRALPSW
jgi:hypothetical protein